MPVAPPATAARPVAPLAPLAPPTIFHEPWWLERATGGAVEMAEVRSGGRLVAWMPYRVSRRRGFRVSVQPHLTHLLGPVIDPGTGSGNNQWLHRIDAMEELAGRLPDLALFSQTCHPGLRDVLGFQARGFSASVQYSAEIAPAAQDQLWRAMRDKTRNVIRKGEKSWRTTELDDPGQFHRLYADNLRHAGQRSYFDLGCVEPLVEAAQRRGQACIRAAIDERGVIGAAVLVVRDASRAWYLMSTRHPGIADNGAVSLLVWRSIQDASRRGLVFDFDGISSEGTARFYAGFGATMCPRFSVTRVSPGYQLATSALAWMRGRSTRNPFTAH
ncbi:MULTISPECIES: GNAT family N-acetyltransferase [Ramlibacter]|uniref:GNAT family N-acetyltransferase n=1 Tax=Ramlibacter TaxID=174951 RepID=UPI0012FCB5E0|nr:GNAT family N-acetyltransferase [Ramlibacter sp. CGMCC 1.13660]